MATSFFWYELMTSDVAAAEDFYRKVVGWNCEAFPGSEMGYTVVKAGETGVGGIMSLPDSARQMGAGPVWLGYIKAADVDAETRGVEAAGGKVHQPPRDIGGGVGRFSVVADPQGAVFMLLQPQGPDMPRAAPMTPGHVAWHELMTTDQEKALAFYAGRFGWTRSHGMDMGEMGTYELYAVDGVDTGGIMKKPPHVPVANWGFYFAVDGIEGAAERTRVNGGSILFGPAEVPGGQWVVNCVDPQGAHFSMVSNTR
jgi:predicted enzyme related to lactoylglutathione lyase